MLREHPDYSRDQNSVWGQDHNLSSRLIWDSRVSLVAAVCGCSLWPCNHNHPQGLYVLWLLLIKTSILPSFLHCQQHNEVFRVVRLRKDISLGIFRDWSYTFNFNLTCIMTLWDILVVAWYRSVINKYYCICWKKKALWTVLVWKDLVERNSLVILKWLSPSERGKNLHPGSDRWL